MDAGPSGKNTRRYFSRSSLGKLGDENVVSEDLMIQQKYAPKANYDPLDKIKGLHPSSMPPCHKVLMY